MVLRFWRPNDWWNAVNQSPTLKRSVQRPDSGRVGLQDCGHVQFRCLRSLFIVKLARNGAYLAFALDFRSTLLSISAHGKGHQRAIRAQTAPEPGGFRFDAADTYPA
jgi:hypothetical protein